MVEVTLPEIIDEDFQQLIPEHRRYVDGLLEEGIFQTYTLSLQSGKLWIVVIAESQKEVCSIIDAVPLRSFITYKVNELTFHNFIPSKFPAMSMN